MGLNNSSDYSKENPNSQYWINSMNDIASDMLQSQSPEDSYFDSSDVDSILANAQSGIVTAELACTKLFELRYRSDSVYIRTNPDAKQRRDKLIASAEQTYQEGHLDLGIPIISKLDSGTKDQVAKILDKFRSGK